ncbi:MAG: ABC transporter substrate-binding protein, partial [Calditrichia bacterium]|nr:ABC transporter substrate-binding protein [Calditrichia bacterium]
DNPGDLDPRTYFDAASYKVIEQVYSSLFRFDSTGLMKPDVADSFKIVNNINYHIFLKKDIYFHDGKPLTAEDVAFTYQWMLDNSGKANSHIISKFVDAIEIVDKYYLVFKLKEIYSPFLSSLTTGIVPKHIAENNDEALHKNPVGSGAFRFVEWQQDSYIKLESYKQYKSGSPYINGIKFLIIPDANTASLAVESGEIDFMMNNFSLSNLERFKSNKELKIKMDEGSNYVYLGLNLRRGPLRKKLVRQAVAYAINKELMLQKLYFNVHKSANSLLSPFHWAYNNDLKVYNFNPEKAKELLDKAGYRDPDGDGPQTRFTLTYSCTEKQESRQKAQVIQNFLQKVGIKVKIKSNEWATFFVDIKKGNFEMCSLTWVGIYDPDIYYQIFHSNSIKDGNNRGRYRNKEVDRLIILAQLTHDLTMKKHYYYQIQEILQEEVPYISLWHETNVAVMKKNLMDFQILPAAEWNSFKKVYWKVEQ